MWNAHLQNLCQSVSEAPPKMSFSCHFILLYSEPIIWAPLKAHAADLCRLADAAAAMPCFSFAADRSRVCADGVDLRLFSPLIFSSSELLSMNPSSRTFVEVVELLRLTRECCSFILCNIKDDRLRERSCQPEAARTLIASFPPGMTSFGRHIDDRSLVGWFESIPATV